METINLDDVEAEEVDGVGSRKILLYSKNLMLVYYEFKPGRIFHPHSHPNEQVGFVIQGKGEFVINGKKVLMEKGSAYIIKPGEPHGFKALGTEKYIEVEVFYPPRKDYIPKTQG